MAGTQLPDSARLITNQTTQRSVVKSAIAGSQRPNLLLKPLAGRCLLARGGASATKLPACLRAAGNLGLYWGGWI